MRLTPPLSLRPALPLDETFLFELYASTRAHELAATGWPREQQLAFLRQQYAARSADYRVRFPQAAHNIVTVEGERIGSMIVHHDASEMRVVDLALTPTQRRRGIGTQLLKAAAEEAESEGKPLTLSVRDDNPAQRLYRRLGFVSMGANNGYIAMKWSAAGKSPACK